MPPGEAAGDESSVVSGLLPRPDNEMFRVLPDGGRMPANGLGMCCRGGAYEFESVRRQVLHYLAVGGRHIDTAELYLNHAPIAVGLRQAMQRYGISREELFVTTKVWPRHFGRETVKARVRQIVRGPSGAAPKVTELLDAGTLEARHHTAQDDNSLHLDYVDLLLMHAPGSFGGTLGLRLSLVQSAECLAKQLNARGCREDTWLGLSELVQEGVIKAAGVSNFNMAQLKELQALDAKKLDDPVKGRIAPISANQIKWNPWAPDFQREIYEYCQAHDITVMAYGSLGMFMEKSKAANQVILRDIAERIDQSVFAIMLRWALQHGAAIIPGTSNPKHMRANLDVYAFELSATDMAALDLLGNDTGVQFMYDKWPEEL